MKKKYAVLLLVIACLFVFTGCCNIFDNGNNNNNNESEQLNTEIITSNVNPNINMPKSSDSIYQKAQKLSLNPTREEIAEKYIDCVVTIFVLNEYDVEISFGSGVCVYSGGYIVTNNHVVRSVLQNKNYELGVCLNNQSKLYYAQVLWTDYNLDIAIIQCINGDIPFVNINDRLINETENPLKLLEPVIAIGTPLDFSLQNTCTYGYISNFNRNSVAETNVYEHLIQHTASISNGNSGGPLFDLKGNLIGLNTLGSNEGNDIYFAVPIYSVELILNKVVKLNELPTRTVLKSPKLGLSLCDKIICEVYGEKLIEEDGLYILSVQVGLNSHNKLNSGDIIKSIELNGLTYEIKCRNDLIYMLLQSKIGDEITVNFKRANALQKVNITLN